MYKFDDLEMFLQERLPVGGGIGKEWAVEVKKNAVVCKNRITLHLCGFGSYQIPFTVRIPIDGQEVLSGSFKLVGHNWKSYITRTFWPDLSNDVYDKVAAALPSIIWKAAHNGLYSCLP